MALQLFERHPIDFIDAYHGALMLARGLTTVYSYDTDFDRLQGLKRVEP
jgi:predicted nucleic acid-binding protein